MSQETKASVWRFVLGLEDESDTSQSTDETQTEETAAKATESTQEGDTAPESTSDTQNHQTPLENDSSTPTEDSQETEEKPLEETPSDGEQASEEKNQAPEVQDESVSHTADAPTNQPPKVEDGQTAVERELGYWCRILDFSQFKQAKSAVKIKDYVSFQEVDDTHPVKSKTRVRRIEGKDGVRFELTIKTGNDVTARMENTTEITEDTFNIMAQAHAQKVTDKHRYTFENEDGEWSVDLFPNGKGGYFEWSHVEVEVARLPETPPKPPIKAEEIIYPKGHNANLTDEEVKAKVDSIVSTLDTMDVNLYETQTELAKTGVEEEETQTPEAPQEENTSQDVPQEGTEPLSADDISRDAEQVEENEEVVKEQEEEKAAEEAEGESTEGTDESPESTETQSETQTDEAAEAPSDEEKITEVSKEATESLVASLESLIQLRAWMKEDIDNGVRYKAAERKRIYSALHRILPDHMVNRFHYQTALEDFGDDHSGGFSEETLDTIEGAIGELIQSITTGLSGQLAQLKPEVGESVNLKSSLLRLRGFQDDTQATITVGSDRIKGEDGIASDEDAINQTQTLNHTVAQTNSVARGLAHTSRIEAYETMLKGLQQLLIHYQKEGHWSQRMQKALAVYAEHVRSILVPANAEHEGHSNEDDSEVYKLQVPSHTLTYRVATGEDGVYARVSHTATVQESHEESVSVGEMKEAVHDTIDTKVQMGKWMESFSQTVPAACQAVQVALQSAYKDKDTLEEGDMNLLATVTDVVTLIEKEVEFIIHLSKLDGELKGYASALLLGL